MLRSVAVKRINDGLGFRPDGHSLEAKIILRLQEAQRDLERGKTLPRFLLEEDFQDTLEAGDHTIPLPAGFIRMSDENRPHFTPVGSSLPTFLVRKLYTDAVLSNLRETAETTAPEIYVIRKTTIDFITTADVDYNLTFSYYKSGDVLDSDIENVWLANAPEWLIGEAGERIALDIRDKDAVMLFGEIKKRGRAAIFGEELAAEQEDMPFQMGLNL